MLSLNLQYWFKRNQEKLLLPSVTNITLYSILFGYTLQLVAEAFRLLHPGGDSSYPWVSVCALGHNFGKDRTFTLYALLEKVLSNKEYTSLHA